MRSLRTEVSRIYQGLGVFYALKCQHQRKLERRSPELAAKFYLDRATKTEPEKFTAWKIAPGLLVLDSPPSLPQAQQFSAASLRVVDKQQRAEYNFAVSEHLSRNFSSAEEHLTRALTLKKWEEEE